MVGSNGAGKSTLIHILTDLIPADCGTVSINGQTYDHHPVARKRQIGVIPEHNPAVPELTGTEYLTFVGRMHELRADKIPTRTKSLIDFFIDGDFPTRKRIENYSAGMRRKFELCGALL